MIIIIIITIIIITIIIIIIIIIIRLHRIIYLVLKKTLVGDNVLCFPTVCL